jgi:hypothetical protein
MSVEMGKLASAALLLVSAATIAYARPKAVATMAAVKTSSDVFALPPPNVLAALSLGYRSALADKLYTDTLIAYGTHGEEHRRFDYVGLYLDAIVGLDPHLCQTYHFADTFIIYQPVGSPSVDDVRHARQLLEKGLEMCPNDGTLWMSAGQFMAFIATQFLTDEEEKKEYLATGARTLAHAAELETANQNVQWQALAAAGIFTREGKREAAISFLERVYSVTDDEELKAGVLSKLAALREEAHLEQRKKYSDRFNEAWRKDMPFVSRTGMLVLGPRYDASDCSGQADRAGCSNSWAAWAKTAGAP